MRPPAMQPFPREERRGGCAVAQQRVPLGTQRGESPRRVDHADSPRRRRRAGTNFPTFDRASDHHAASRAARVRRTAQGAVHLPCDVRDVARRQVLVNRQLEDVRAEEARVRTDISLPSPTGRSRTRAHRRRGAAARRPRRALFGHEDREKERADAVGQHRKHRRHVRADFAGSS